MKKKDIENLKEAIEQEGFDYAMSYYSDWSEVEDEEFQHLYREAQSARFDLVVYLREQGIDFQAT